MKKIVLILIATLFLKTAISQTVNYFVDGSIWTYYTTESSEPGICTTQNILEQDSILGDTLIYSLTYKKVFVTSQVNIQLYPPCLFGGGAQPITTSEKYIRFDSTTSRVYMVNDTGTFYPELLIYDFNLIVGDTIPLNNNSIVYGSIDSVNTISFFGIQTRKFYLPNYAMGNYIIEGVGGSNGLTNFNPNAIVLSGGIYMTNLICFHTGDSLYNPSNSSCPQFIPVGVLEIYDSENSINIWPNPFSTRTTISFSSEQTKTNIKITNSMGQVVNTYLFSGRELEIKSCEFSAGIYYVQITNEKKINLYRKIIIQ